MDPGFRRDDGTLDGGWVSIPNVTSPSYGGVRKGEEGPFKPPGPT